jgi:hypothetical protein
MISKLIRRMNAATVLATVALVLAMSGGAYAASRYIITSTRQISPKVLKTLKGAAGAAGKAGATGATGPVGPAGPAGAAGTAGTAGAAGTAGGTGPAGASVVSKTIPPGAACAAGGSEFTVSGSTPTHACNGTNGTTGFTSTLPEGDTETGAWSVFFQPSTVTQETYVTITFAIPLSEPISNNPTRHAFYVTLEEQKEENGQKAPSQCSGTAEAPTAEAGDLCLYEGSASFPETEPTRQPFLGPQIFKPGAQAGLADEGIGTTGAIVFAKSRGGAEDESTNAFGSFAVTSAS